VGENSFMIQTFLGLDLSLRATGCVSVDREGKVVINALIKTKATEGNTEEIERLLKIRDACTMAVTWGTSLVAIEGPSFMSGPMATALTQLSGLSYLVRAELYKSKFQFIIVAPTTLKKFATGKGNCDKNVVMLEVYKRWGESFTDDNLCDAYVLAQIARMMCGHSKPENKAQEEVMKTLKPQYNGPTKND
jgi:crossover junction endodeoxyribonuclease RuvC